VKFQDSALIMKFDEVLDANKHVAIEIKGVRKTQVQGETGRLLKVMTWQSGGLMVDVGEAFYQRVSDDDH